MFPPAKASVKGDNKRLTSPGSSWSCRTTSTTEEEEEEECRRSSFRGGKQLFSFAITSNGSCLEGKKRSISDQISGILRAHLTNGILSMFLPPPSLISTRRNFNVATACPCCLWLLWVWLYCCSRCVMSWSLTDMIKKHTAVKQHLCGRLAGLWEWSGLLCTW